MKNENAEQTAQQEPVAAQSVMTVRIWRDKNGDQNAEFKNWHKLPDGEHILYTSPPAQQDIQRLSALVRAQQITIDKLEAQRTWVEMSDERIKGIFSYHGKFVSGKDLPMLRVIEAMLKENT